LQNPGRSIEDEDDDEDEDDEEKPPAEALYLSIDG
jgi:hypothetical protein